MVSNAMRVDVFFGLDENKQQFIFRDYTQAFWLIGLTSVTICLHFEYEFIWKYT